MNVPRGTQGPFPKHGQRWHSKWGQFPGTGQNSRALSYPATCPPGVYSGRSPILDSQGSKDEEMNSLVSQNLPDIRKDVKITKQ